MAKRARIATNEWLQHQGRGCDAEADDVAVAAQELHDFVVTKHVAGKMTADEVCHLANLVTRSKGRGLEQFDVGCNDSSRVKNAARKVSTVLAREYTSPNVYETDIILNEKIAATRLATPFCMLLPHELIATNYVPGDHPDMTYDQRSIDIPAFGTHPVVVEARTQGLPCNRVVPVGLYWDGVQYNNKDTVVAFYIHNMNTGRKYIWCAVRTPLSDLAVHDVRLSMRFDCIPDAGIFAMRWGVHPCSNVAGGVHSAPHGPCVGICGKRPSMHLQP